MLMTLTAPKINPPSASVAAKINASKVSSQSIGLKRRCAHQKRIAMITAVPPTDNVMSCCMLPEISAVNAGRPV